MKIKNPLLRLVYKLTAISLGLVIVNISVGIIGERLLNRLPDFGDETCIANYAITRLETDFLILGSSRANHHYIPSLLQDSIKKINNTDYSVFNAGRDGQNLLYNSCVLYTTIERKRPKIVVFEVGVDELNKETDNIEITKLYYFEKEIIKKTLDHNDKFMRFKMFSNMYRFNPGFIKILYSSLKPSAKYDNLSGYIPLPVETPPSALKMVTEYYDTNIHSYLLERFNQVIEWTEKENIKLIFSISPCLVDYNKDALSLKTMEEICKSKSIPFINNSDNEYFLSHPELFKDYLHLNHNGAIIYTNMFFEQIKEFIN